MDYAAATPMDQRVQTAMEPYFKREFYNPSATYLAGKKIRKALEESRHQVAQVIGARPAEIIFTAGGTEANNLAVQGVMRQFPRANMVTTAIEHDSILEPAKLFKAQLAPVRHDGLVDVKALAQLINNHTVLVSVMYASNEIGVVQSLRQISRELDIIRAQRRAAHNELPLYFHSDAAQAGNYLDIHVARLGVDLMTLNGGKIYGPKASGVLYKAAHVSLQPIIFGGGQEFNVRSGTENVAASIGFSVALAIAQADRHAAFARMQRLQQLFLKMLDQHLPDAVVNGSLTHRLPNNVHISLPGKDNERLLFELDEAGIMAAAGSACSASSDEPSHVLTAIGISEDMIRASLRFTFGRQTSENHIKTVIKVLNSL